MSMQPLFLAKHAFACMADHHCVFLDLRQDKYLCLGREHSSAMESLLTNPLGPATRSMKSSGSGQLQAELLKTVTAHGLIVHNDKDGKALTLTRALPPSTHLNELTTPGQRVFNTRDIRSFLSAALFATIRLRWGSLVGTVRSAERRKCAGVKHNNAPGSQEMTELVSVFRTLRPYYPREYRCLFDSLALIRFLARYGYFPQWVFGVKMEPFAAHCWVQDGDVVLNDVVENVRPYTPIMVI